VQLITEQDATILQNYTTHSLQMASAVAYNHRLIQFKFLDVAAEQRARVSEGKKSGN
jgi:hypothetical protein